METNGFSDPSRLERCLRVVVKGTLETRGWGNSMQRNTVEAKDATIDLDWQARAFRIVPFRGLPFFVPMEHVQQWFPLPPPSTDEPSPAGPTPSPIRRKRPAQAA